MPKCGSVSRSRTTRHEPIVAADADRRHGERCAQPEKVEAVEQCRLSLHAVGAEVLTSGPFRSTDSRSTGHSLGFAVLAEGVETEVAWRQLELLGCDEIQGTCLRVRCPPSTSKVGSRHIATPTNSENRSATSIVVRASHESSTVLPTTSPRIGGSSMGFIKRVGASFRGFGKTIVAIPRDIKRYRSMKRM